MRATVRTLLKVSPRHSVGSPPVKFWITFRQRETQRGESNDASPDVQGAVEVRWTAEGRFEPFMGARFPVPAGPMVATVRPLGRQMWLVERRFEHGSEGMYALGAEAVLRSAAKRTCAGVVAKGP